MIHDLKLYEQNFNRIKNGKKTREYRLNDEKRKKIKVGDIIRFVKLPEKKENLFVVVTNKEDFNDWFSCYSKYYDEDFSDRYDSVQEVVNDTYNGGYYTKEESNKYGCCCISFIKINDIDFMNNNFKKD